VRWSITGAKQSTESFFPGENLETPLNTFVTFDQKTRIDRNEIRFYIFTARGNKKKVVETAI
jgi:hypothetical protein